MVYKYIKEGFLKMFETILDDKVLKENLIFASIYIALYESFVCSIVDKPKELLCKDCFEDNEYKQKETENYRQCIKNRIVDDKGNKDITKASFLWFVENNALPEDDFDDFLAIKGLRNDLAHELFSCIVKGFDDSHAKLFGKLLGMYMRIDNYWINNFDIPTSGEYLQGEYDKENVSSLESILFQAIFDKIFFDKED